MTYPTLAPVSGSGTRHRTRMALAIGSSRNKIGSHKRILVWHNAREKGLNYKQLLINQLPPLPPPPPPPPLPPRPQLQPAFV